MEIVIRAIAKSSIVKGLLLRGKPLVLATRKKIVGHAELTLQHAPYEERKYTPKFEETIVEGANTTASIVKQVMHVLVIVEH